MLLKDPQTIYAPTVCPEPPEGLCTNSLALLVPSRLLVGVDKRHHFELSDG